MEEIKTKQEICDILGVTSSTLRKIESRNKLYERLHDKGYRLIEKIKYGKTFKYKVIDVCKQTKTKQEVCGILEVNKETLKKIEQKEQLNNRLKEKGYEFVSKNKKGRNCEYVIRKCEPEISEIDKNFNVEREFWKSIGIYKIELGNEIYIGSTIAGFRKRYMGHLRKPTNEDVGRILNEGAIFSIMQICDGMDEDDIRRIEDNYIEEYKNNSYEIYIS